jgi:hypothetical protein
LHASPKPESGTPDERKREASESRTTRRARHRPRAACGAPRTDWDFINRRWPVKCVTYGERNVPADRAARSVSSGAEIVAYRAGIPSCPEDHALAQSDTHHRERSGMSQPSCRLVEPLAIRRALVSCPTRRTSRRVHRETTEPCPLRRAPFHALQALRSDAGGFFATSCRLGRMGRSFPESEGSPSRPGPGCYTHTAAATPLDRGGRRWHSLARGWPEP